jgi:hypothetical protein
MDKNISWKQKIKYAQIAVFLLAIVAYNVFFYVKDVYAQNNDVINQIDNINTKQVNLQSELEQEVTKLNNIKDIYKNKDVFIKAYNTCYTQYKNRIYSL